MTVISLKNNRYNLVTQKVSWQKRIKALNKGDYFVAFLNILLIIIISFSIFFSLLAIVKISNYRLDVKSLSSEVVDLEHQNAELQNQLMDLKNFNNLSKIFSEDNLVFVNNSSYFSISKSTTEVGLKNFNNL